MVDFWMQWTILIFAIGFVIKIEATNLEECGSQYVNFNTNQTTKIQCQHKPGYNFSDGGVQSVTLYFLNGYYSLFISNDLDFSIEDNGRCPIDVDKDNVNSFRIFLAPDFDDVNGCGIRVDDSYLWGAIMLIASETGVIFPLQKTNEDSDISMATAQVLAGADSRGSDVRLNISQFHKLGDVSPSREVFAYQYADRVYKVYLDVTIKITQEVYTEMKGKNSPRAVGATDCQYVHQMLQSGSFFRKANAMLVAMVLPFIWLTVIIGL